LSLSGTRDKVTPEDSFIEESKSTFSSHHLLTNEHQRASYLSVPYLISWKSRGISTLLLEQTKYSICPVMEEIRFFCLACLGTEFYMATLDLIDGTQAWVHMCVECNIRMEYSGT